MTAIWWKFPRELISQSKLECLEQTTTLELEDTTAIMETHIKPLIIKTKICLKLHIRAYQAMAQVLIADKYLHYVIML